MIDFVKLIIIGALIGFSPLVAGISGGALALSLGIYERALEVLGNVFKGFKKNILFLLPLALGAVVAYFLAGWLVTHFLTINPLVTILFFSGVLFGGILALLKKSRGDVKDIPNLLVMAVGIVGVIFLSFLSPSTPVVIGTLEILDFFMLMVMGLVMAATVIVPGVSTEIILSFFGYYQPITGAFSGLLTLENFGDNILILLPVVIGLLVGLWLLANLIGFLLKKCQTKAYFALLGIVAASIISIFLRTEIFLEVGYIMLGALMFTVGLVASVKLSEVSEGGKKG